MLSPLGSSPWGPFTMPWGTGVELGLPDDQVYLCGNYHSDLSMVVPKCQSVSMETPDGFPGARFPWQCPRVGDNTTYEAPQRHFLMAVLPRGEGCYLSARSPGFPSLPAQPWPSTWLPCLPYFLTSYRHNELGLLSVLTKVGCPEVWGVDREQGYFGSLAGNRSYTLSLDIKAVVGDLGPSYSSHLRTILKVEAPGKAQRRVQGDLSDVCAASQGLARHVLTCISHLSSAHPTWPCLSFRPQSHCVRVCVRGFYSWMLYVHSQFYKPKSPTLPPSTQGLKPCAFSNDWDGDSDIHSKEIE